MLKSVGDVIRAVGGGALGSAFNVRDQREHSLTLTCDGVEVVVIGPELWGDEALAERSRAGECVVLLCGTASEFAGGVSAHWKMADGEQQLVTPLVLPAPAEALALALTGLARGGSGQVQRNRALYVKELLIDIGRALGKERDIHALLDLILTKARDVTGADAGSVYVVEGEQDDISERTLRFVEAQNDSLGIESEGFTMPVSPSSIVGACVLAGEVINIPDLYALDAPGTGNNPRGFRHDRSYDERNGYQTRSMVTIPMISARSQVIGVIQLINQRAPGVEKLDGPDAFDRDVRPFDEVSINYANALAAQAGIGLETALLYDEVRTLFEGFVHASVTAIEARDPTTSGHSVRVADLTVELARVTDRTSFGQYSDFTASRDDIKQIEYAALLHDFGKVGVREHVLVKAEKLYEHERALIESRFEFIRRSLQVEQLQSKVKYLMEASREAVAAELENIDRMATDRIKELDDFVLFILKANQPTVLEEAGFERINEIASRCYKDVQGKDRPYLTEGEAKALQIARGSLTAEERLEIESHVVHTYNFLREIPWGRVYRNVPSIAGAHHEKLDGTGYPNRLAEPDIPLPARMMTISDIFDALTASDRPYKKAVPVTKALDILADEVKRGKLDSHLYDLFLDAKVYQIVLHDD